MVPGVELALGFVLSYIANNIPALRDILDRREDINDRLEACFRSAVNSWNVTQEMKDTFLTGGMQRHLADLKSIVVNPQKGVNPKEKELLQKWADYIWADPTCNTFLKKHKDDIEHAEAQKAILSAKELIQELKEYQEAEFKRLNQKMDTLLKRGAVQCEQYWKRKFTTQDIVLPYSVILGGREDAIKKVEEVLDQAGVLYVKSETRQESMAFVAAVVSTHKTDASRPTYIVDDINVYREIAEQEGPEIIITSLSEDTPWCAVANKHSVIVCFGKGDKATPGYEVQLPSIDNHLFVDALKESGLQEAKARKLAKEASFDVNCLWRNLSIVEVNEVWNTPENERLLLPALLIGAWNDSFPNDRELVSQMAGMPYDEYKAKLQLFVSKEESPFKVINTEWRLKTPRTMLETYKNDISIDSINMFFENIEWLFEDDDPEAEAKRNATELQLWQDKNAYSYTIKEGAFQTLALLSIIYESDSTIKNKINLLVRTKLKDFTLSRYISNKRVIKWIAEAAPEMFLEFLENDIRKGDELASKLFEIKKSNESLTNTKVFYIELLWVLESIAWDENLLPRVTAILMHYCKYPNESGYVNKPINSLYNIYRFPVPQTFATFEQRLAILNQLSENNSVYIYDLCMRILKGLDSTAFDTTVRFAWRWNERYDNTSLNKTFTYKEIESIVELAMRHCSWSKYEIESWLNLSTSPMLVYNRTEILDCIRLHLDAIWGDEKIIHTLRVNIIHRNIMCRDANWALNSTELDAYRRLLKDIVPNDIISKNKHIFENIFISDPAAGIGVDNLEYAKKKRKETLQLIIDALGEDGIWQLEKNANSKEAVAAGLVELTKSRYSEKVYRKWAKGELTEDFTSRYYSELYYTLGEQRYLKIVDELRSINADTILIVLCAPSFKRSLASIAEGLSREQENLYWQKVALWQIEPQDASYVLEKMKKANRYGDILQHFFTFNKNIVLPENERVAILCEMYEKGDILTLANKAYQVSEILKTISLPQTQPQRNEILQIEFLLYQNLQHYMPGLSLHIVREINNDPEVLMSLVEIIYMKDKGYRDEIKEEESEFRKQLAQMGWSFMYHYHQVPCLDDEGNVDGEKLRKYIGRLQDLMREKHYETVMPLVLGKILGDMPEKADYPSDIMCQLVEELNDDRIDAEIGCAIFNRRGMTTRSPFEGGTIERAHIETMEKYKKRASLRSPRLVKVFNDTIMSYEEMARHEDEQAERLKHLR